MTSEKIAREPVSGSVPAAVDDRFIEELVAWAQSEGLQLTGEGGLLQQLTKRLLESALEGEMTDHLGYDRHDPAGKNGGNSRNGRRSKTVVTDVGPVEIAVPRDREGGSEPQIVKKRQRRLTGVDEMVLSLSAKGLTHGEISSHLAEVYGAEVSKQTISTITDSVMEGMADWQARPLARVYPVVFVDCINVKIREGQVANRPIYMALAVTAEGHRDILGLWAGGEGGEGAKHWLWVLTELKNRGVEDVLMLVCDGLKGLPDAVGEVWPQTVVQTCVVHLLRASFRYAGRQDWDKIAKALKPVYTAPTEDAATSRFLEFSEEWGKRYPAIVRLWENAWAEFVPFLQFDAEIRRIVCTTNAIESVNARIRRAVRSGGVQEGRRRALPRRGRRADVLLCSSLDVGYAARRSHPLACRVGGAPAPARVSGALGAPVTVWASPVGESPRRGHGPMMRAWLRSAKRVLRRHEDLHRNAGAPLRRSGSGRTVERCPLCSRASQWHRRESAIRHRRFQSTPAPLGFRRYVPVCGAGIPLDAGTRLSPSATSWCVPAPGSCELRMGWSRPGDASFRPKAEDLARQWMGPAA